MNTVADSGTRRKYLVYLAGFADELRGAEVVLNDDIERLNRELDGFIQQPKANECELPLIKALEDSRMTTIATAPSTTS